MARDEEAPAARQVGYEERARFYDVEYRTDIDLPYLRSLVTPEVRSVLEIPCGAGRNLEWLAGTGRQVVCADLADAMVARVQERIRALGAHDRVTAVQADMCRLQLGQRFDLVLVPQEALQLLSTEDDARRALTRLAQHLSPHGKLFLDLHTFTADSSAHGPPSPLPDYFDPAVPDGDAVVEWRRPVPGGLPDGGWLERSRRQWTRAGQVDIDYHYTLGDSERVLDRWSSSITVQRYDRQALDGLAARSGLTVTHLSSDYSGTPWQPGSARMAAVLSATSPGQGGAP